MILKLFFWIFFFILFYTYLGYAVLLFFLNLIKKWFFKSEKVPGQGNYEPDVCLFVTAFNERDFVKQKVENSFSLDYPKEKIQYLWITDGSDDGTPDILKAYEGLEIHHLPERRGKMHAMNRGMHFVKTPVVIFSDTNTRLGKNSIREIVAHFSNPKIGCVAGEKRIVDKKEDGAAGAGEGLYWRFESWIKEMDSNLNSAVGAVGELFAIRTELFEAVEEDTILDDFVISLRIAQKKFRIAYSPGAYAEETASVNVNEELKRKIRIAAGGIQTIFRLKSLLNPFRYGILSWQYFSHKVLRWTLAPVSLFLLLPLNILVVFENGNFDVFGFYFLFLALQLVLYLFAFIGWYFENQKLRLKILFVPYYFVAINYAEIRGIIRFLKGKQAVTWEKSKRA
ncbi:glycosyltransferase [Maribellus comscasis]|uniref:Glycosyltransferase n=1 Tax=Maribellus comscasis TaxID=2681766 RepID=A0A6I6JR45_9BACT|nr:glycosyltransferase family 2 protein [Maribellus comscasis]QGY45426.1 glycosyltransferase [Maribellus comscasis]